MRKIFIVLLGVSFILSFFSATTFADSLKIAAAANLKEAIDEIKTLYEKDNAGKVEVIVGSSGKLAAQVENGAPFDIFMSADMKYPEMLFKEGLTNEPRVYAQGILVLWTVKDIDLKKGLEVLKDPSVKKIALANPQTAPYGREAVNAVKFYNLYESVSSKFVYGESISQASEFIQSQAADVGFTSKSTVLSANLKQKGQWIELEEKTHKPISQGIVILKYGQTHHAEDAQRFYNFIFSETARGVFIKYGYIVP